MNPLVRSVIYDEEVHDASSFSCGRQVFDIWLRSHAARAQLSGTASTYVWVHREHGVIGYYALSAHALVKDELPPPAAKGEIALIPASLISKLALDQRFHGEGHGGALLADALSRSLSSRTQSVAIRLIIVEAIDFETAGFYRRHGFSEVRNSRIKLVMKANTAEEACRRALDDS